MISGIGNSLSGITTGIGGKPGAVSVGSTNAGQARAASALSTVATIVSEGAPIDTDRVAALRAAIKAGSYRPDASAIASKMIEVDL